MKKWKGFEHGVNFGGWLSQCRHSTDHYDTFIKENDFKQVQMWGMDHIRIPVDYNLFENEKGEFLNQRFEYIEFAVQMCRKYKLNMILDLHRTPGFAFDPAYGEEGFFDNGAMQEHFYLIWEELSKRFGKYKDMLAFELLNEVTEKEYGVSWNRIIKNCVRRIRNVVPEIPIIIGGYWNNSCAAVPDLPVLDDEHIIYTFHCYEPLLFTHQGACWIPSMKEDYRCHFKMSFREYENDGVKLLGKAFNSVAGAMDMDAFPDEEYFEWVLNDAVKTAEERNVVLYCGEYGVIDRAPSEEVLEWYRTFHRVLKKHGIGSAAWCYKEMDFGLLDARLNTVRPELLRIIKEGE